MVSSAKSTEFSELKNTLKIPEPSDSSIEAAKLTVSFLKTVFLEYKYSLLDAIVSVTGQGPSSQSDTHYRGRVLEAVLNGSFDGLSRSDFAYAELKLIETISKNKMCQVMTAGRIFKKTKKDYEIDHDYDPSKFYKKMKTTIIVGYQKQGKQLGFDVNGVYLLDIENPIWAKELKEDWISIRDAMIQAIADEKAGKIKRKASGILSSRHKTPNGLLGVRSDSVIIRNKLFQQIVECQ